jgi:hypothetical protein
MAKTQKLIKQSKTEIDRLIAKLDPNRDYGWRKFNSMEAYIRSGEIVIAEGVNLPVLRDARTGKVIKGSGKAITQSTRRDAFRKEFNEVASPQVRGLVESLIDRGLNGDTRAAIYVIDRVLGQATPEASNTPDDPIIIDAEQVYDNELYQSFEDQKMERLVEQIEDGSNDDFVLYEKDGLYYNRTHLPPSLNVEDDSGEIVYSTTDPQEIIGLIKAQSEASEPKSEE